MQIGHACFIASRKDSGCSARSRAAISRPVRPPPQVRYGEARADKLREEWRARKEAMPPLRKRALSAAYEGDVARV